MFPVQPVKAGRSTLVPHVADSSSALVTSSELRVMVVCLKPNVHIGTAGQVGRGKWALQALCLVPAVAAAPALALAVALASGYQIRTIFVALQLVALRDAIPSRGWGFCAIF